MTDTDTTATTYADDPRVTPDEGEGGGFTVHHDGEQFRILFTPGGAFAWAVCVGPDLQFAVAADESGKPTMLIGFQVADDAIGVLLGNPCVSRNDDGTYTIHDPEGGDWTVSGSDETGWVAEHPDDGFDDDRPWATAADAVNAVCGDPATSRRVGDEEPPA